MTARRVLPSVAVVAALVVSLILALLAADVLRWQRSLESGDARFGSVAGDRGMWTPDTLLPAGASRRLLGVDDDVAFREAVQSFRFARPRAPVTRFSQLAARGAADRALARVARGHQARERAATVANLRGVLALEEARTSQGNAGTPLRRAITHFRQAVTLDRQNDDAKFNLELALQALSSSDGAGSGGGGERTATPASGAGAATSGTGY
jgi:hypothetical protein